MNVGVVLTVMLLVFAGSIGLVAMASTNQNSPVDTFDQTLSPQSNNTHQVLTQTAAPIAQTGGGFGILLAVIFVCGLLLGTVVVLYSGYGKGSYSSRRL